ncbi:hypothetical protein ACFSJY_05110 [Thalassotalea euphylliae]|uniref:hypothetical protein n=1 Tax=Thalassotalea euphylliae TaxID=1655234 RepID=UPI003629E941
MVPIHGEQYDKLIVLTQLKAINSYNLSIPSSVNSSNELPSVFVIYDKKESSNTQPVQFVQEIEVMGFAERVIDFFWSSDGDVLNIVFTSKEKEGYNRTLKVSWPSEVCSTSASKKMF